MPARAQPTPFVEDYLPALLAQASELISGEFHEVVRASGFTVSEWRVLATLVEGGSKSIGALAQISLTKQPTMTRLLDRMEAKGYVERVASNGDRRLTFVRITEAGRREVSRLMVLAREHEERVLRPFGLERARELKSILRAIIDLHRRPPAETA